MNPKERNEINRATINTKMECFFQAVIFGVLFSVLNVILTSFINEVDGFETLHRLSVLLGGNIKNGGYIQTLTIIAFLWAILEIKHKKFLVQREKMAFKLSVLPKNETKLNRESIERIQEQLEKFNESKNFLLIDVLNTACAKFKMGNSISEVIDISSMMIKVHKEKSETSFANIRYLNWVIPSLGFIGTVLGISGALKIANSGDLNMVTATLGVAFDTTLVSLILSIVIMKLINILEQDSDEVHMNIEEYVIKNLINKIDPEDIRNLNYRSKAI